jgi:ribonuclease VapC
LILDSSAIITVLLREPDHEIVLGHMSRAEQLGAGAPTLAECGIVLSARLGTQGKTLLGRFVGEAGLVVIPFGPHHWSVAIDAFMRFGKGRHPAALNFGDCLTYATAHLAEAPLLYVGEDFTLTDLSLVH